MKAIVVSALTVAIAVAWDGLGLMRGAVTYLEIGDDGGPLFKTTGSLGEEVAWRQMKFRSPPGGWRSPDG